MHHSDIGFDSEQVSVGYASEVYDTSILSSQFFCEPKTGLKWSLYIF